MSICTPRLHPARLAGLGQPLGVRKRCADHEQRVAAVDHVGGGLRAQQADRAGDEGQVVWHRGAPVERLGDAGAEQVGDLDDLVGRALGTLSDEHGDLGARVERLGGAAQVLVARADDGGVVGRGPGVERAVGARRLLVGELLHVGGDDDRGHGLL